MRHILLITSSPSGEDSLSTRLANQLTQKLAGGGKGAVTRRDLAASPLPHVASPYVLGRITPAEARTPEQAAAVNLAQTLIEELRAADTVVISSAMINFAPSTQLKAWFDHVLWPGVTVKFSETGAQGLITNKKVYLVTAAGGHYAEGPMAAVDFQSGYLKHLLGFIGLTDVEQIRLEGTAYGPDATEAAIAQASAQIERIASMS